MARSNSGPTRCGSRTTCAARRWNGSAAPRKLRSSRMLETVDLALPAGPEDLRKLKIGTVVYLSGRIFTAREGAYKHAIEEGAGMPASREALGLANFHCSPAATVNPDGSYTVGAVTATASFRFAQWLDGWFKLSGCNVIIGKGGMTSEVYRKFFVPNRAIYLTTVGYGTGALLGRGIKRVAGVYWLGAGTGGLGTRRGEVRALLGGKRSCRQQPLRAGERENRARPGEIVRRHQTRHAAPLRRDRRQDRGSDLRFGLRDSFCCRAFAFWKRAGALREEGHAAFQSFCKPPHCGSRSGCATILAVLAAWYQFLPPAYSFELGYRELVQLLLFAFFCVINLAVVAVVNALMDHARAQEENARILLDCVPVGIVVVDAQGNIKLVNASTEKLFGYKRFELLDRSIEVLVPVRLGDMHKAERKTFLQKPEARPMGAGRDLTARRRDGSEFPVEIGLNLVSHDGSSAVMATVIDISERKRAQQGQHARAATGTTSTSPAGS